MNDIHKLEFGYLLNQVISKLQKPQSGSLSFVQNLIIPAVLFVLVVVLLILVRKILSIKNSLKEQSMILELTPPSFTEKKSYTTDQLFSIIHSLGTQRSFIDKLLGYKTRLSLEIVSTQNQGIRYLIRTSPKQVNTLKKNLLSYMPHLRVKTVNEYLPENTDILKKHFHKIIEFKLSKHFAFSLRRQSELDKHDPIAYLTGQMTKLAPSELISLQLVVSPAKSRGTKKIAKLISANGDVIKYLRTPTFLLKWLLYNSYRALKTKSLSEMEVVNSIDSKINQPLFETTIRLLMAFKEKSELLEREQGFKSSFSTYALPGYQSLVTKKYLPLQKVKQVYDSRKLANQG